MGKKYHYAIDKVSKLRAKVHRMRFPCLKYLDWCLGDFMKFCEIWSIFSIGNSGGCDMSINSFAGDGGMNQTQYANRNWQILQ